MTSSSGTIPESYGVGGKDSKDDEGCVEKAKESRIKIAEGRSLCRARDKRLLVSQSLEEFMGVVEPEKPRVLMPKA
jgi:hypothetical protein